MGSVHAPCADLRQVVASLEAVETFDVVLLSSREFFYWTLLNHFEDETHAFRQAFILE